MVILPKSYIRKRLRSILAYKYVEVEYEFPASSEGYCFVPVDMKHGKVINFKFTSNVGATVEFLALSSALNSIETITTDTVLWYENVEMGKVFDTDIEAFCVNTKYERPAEYKEYFNSSPYEGLYLYFKAASTMSTISLLVVYEDLDNMK